MLFTTAYLPPVSYFVLLYNANEVLIEACENYNKQSYRNRCRISAANGKMDLNIPIEKSTTGNRNIKNIRIADHTNWQQQHWRSITSAYNTSPFFEFYEDEFRCFYKKKWQFLWDYNLDILMFLLNLLNIEKKINFTSSFMLNVSDVWDAREAIHPKRKSTVSMPTYYQVFNQKHGFLEDLSIIDLIFNMGNEAIFTLMESKIINN